MTILFCSISVSILPQIQRVKSVLKTEVVACPAERACSISLEIHYSPHPSVQPQPSQVLLTNVGRNSSEADPQLEGDYSKEPCHTMTSYKDKTYSAPKTTCLWKKPR